MAKPLYNPNQQVIISKDGKYWSGIVQFWYYDSVLNTTTYQISTNVDPNYSWIDQAVKNNIYLDVDIFGAITKQIP